MKLSTITTCLLVAVLFHLTACGPAIRKFVNGKYPPVSSVERSAASVQNSLSEMEQLKKADLGVRMDQAFLDSSLQAFFQQLYEQDPTLGIPSIEKLDIERNPDFKIGKQEMIISAELLFHVKDNKYLKNVTIDFTGRLSPSVNEDSLKISPSFQRMQITKLKLKRWLFLGRVAKNAVNSLLKEYMDNINGQIKNLVVKLNYPPFPEKPLSELLGENENLKITNDYTFKLSRKTLRPVILLKPGSLCVMAGIEEKPAGAIGVDAAKAAGEALPMPPLPSYLLQQEQQEEALTADKLRSVSQAGPRLQSVSDLQPASLSPEEFDQLFARYDTLFTNTWNSHLDSLPEAGAVNTSVRLSYDVLGRIMDELLKDAQFGLRYNVNMQSNFPEKTISLGEIGKPDCGAITFQCDFRNCSAEMSDCGSCRWYDAWCQARRAACYTANAVKWAACQAFNGARATWCAAELVARKTLCYAELAAIFVYDNLVKNIGTFSGSAAASGFIEGNINRTIPGGISNLHLLGNINADVNARVALNFSPSGIIGHLLCTFPFNEVFSLEHIRVNQHVDLVADIIRETGTDEVALAINFRKIKIPLQFSEPLLVELLKKPLLLLNCGFSIGLGITVTTVLALAGNESFKNYLRAALFGTYQFEFEQSFDLKIPGIPVKVVNREHVFHPAWGEKSIVFTKK